MSQPAHVDLLGEVSVRPWRPGDEALVAAAEPLLSPSSLYARFFTGGHRFPPHYLDRLAAGGTVVAIAFGDAIGWAEVVPYADRPYAADLGVLVVDAWQHRGIGPMLAREALWHARRRGISLVHADVMEGNAAARRALARTFGTQLTATADGDVLHYVLPPVAFIESATGRGPGAPPLPVIR